VWWRSDAAGQTQDDGAEKPLESLVILIPVALFFTALAIWALLWAIRTGQYDDLDEQPPSPPPKDATAPEDRP
jgi:cbb3-type cytochrome oxidase maturation protein